MNEATGRQSLVDEEYLKLLSIGYLIALGIGASFGRFGFIHVLPFDPAAGPRPSHPV